MLRISIALIALTLAGGPDAALLCRTLCDQGAPPVVACQHDGTASAVTASTPDCCALESPVGPAVLFKAAGHAAASFDVAFVILGHGLQFAPPSNSARPGHATKWLGAFEPPSLSTILRI